MKKLDKKKICPVKVVIRRTYEKGGGDWRHFFVFAGCAIRTETIIFMITMCYQGGS